MVHHSNTRWLGLFLIISFFSVNIASAQKQSKDIEIIYSGKLRPEIFYGKNLTLLNNCNDGDKAVWQRHTIDINFGALYGQEKYGHTAVDMHMTMRNRGIWGVANSIAETTQSDFKLAGAVVGKHSHFIPKYIYWMREIWLRMVLNDAFDLQAQNTHTLTMGAFPFELGRGIALGSAYAIAPGLIGFYTESAVDQYPFGAKISGDLIQKKLAYDIYAGILRNSSAHFGDTGSRILGQEYGRKQTPARGFGIIDYVVATRFIITFLKDPKTGSLSAEPYATFIDAPEQRVEFLGDAESKLGTLGCAAEYVGKRFECGIDGAVNFGRQHVKGWDRNTIKVENRDGVLTFVNSHVIDIGTGKKAILNPSDGARKKAIEYAVQDQDFNDRPIGQNLKNSKNRFRNPYTNIFEGWMLVADAALWIMNRQLALSIEGGVSSGDENPNTELIDGNFKGFLGLQSVYSGNRVKSAFVLGGAGKLKRPLSSPVDDRVSDSFASSISGFTNLAYVGAGLTWQPKESKRRWVVNPNVISYWQEFATHKFDINQYYIDKGAGNTFNPGQLDEKANKHLGVELNTFVSCQLLGDLKYFFVGSIFVPGNHYRDIKSKPLSDEFVAALDALDFTSFSDEAIPGLGDDVAFTFNMGVEFRF